MSKYRRIKEGYLKYEVVRKECDKVVLKLKGQTNMKSAILRMRGEDMDSIYLQLLTCLLTPRIESSQTCRV